MEPLQSSQLKPSVWETNPNLKTLLLIFIGVFLLSGIGLAVFMQWTSIKQQKAYEDTKAGLPQHKASLSASQLISQSEGTTTPTDITEWKTYKNDQYGFEFQYPKGWEVKTEIGNLNIFNIYSTNNDKNDSITLSVNALLTNENLFDAFKRVNGVEPSNLQNKEISISGLRAFEYINVTGNNTYTSTAFLYKNNFFQIISYKESQNYINLLSTFKFTNQTDTTNWKTYKNDKYGFEFQYDPKIYEIDDLNFGVVQTPFDDLISFYNIKDLQESQKCQCGEVGRFQVLVGLNRNALSLEDLEKKYFSESFQIADSQRLKITGIDAIEFGEMSRIILLTKNNYVYEIRPTNDILATFKFTK